MLICHCRAVNDRAVRDTIAAGACEPQQIASGCGAGSRCGGCIPALLELLAEALPSARSPRTSAAPSSSGPRSNGSTTASSSASRNFDDMR